MLSQLLLNKLNEFDTSHFEIKCNSQKKNEILCMYRIDSINNVDKFSSEDDSCKISIRDNAQSRVFIYNRINDTLIESNEEPLWGNLQEEKEELEAFKNKEKLRKQKIKDYYIWLAGMCIIIIIFITINILAS